MDFYVFDLDFNFIGIIDDYINIPITRSYDAKSSFTIEVTPTEHNLNLLKKERLIAKKDDLEHAFIIDTVDFKDGKDSSLNVTVFSLHHLLNRRAIIDQQIFSGKIGKVMSDFVNANAVNPTNTKRKIPKLIIASSNNNLGVSVTEGRTDGYLDEVLFEIANKYNLSWDVLFDYNNQQFVFVVWQGVDRSQQQTVNSHVIFAKEFDNVINQNYVTSYNEYRNTAIVAGEGEGAARKRVIVNDANTGFNRRELFVDARDLQSEYTDENDNEIVLTNAEYLAMLTERGKSKLSEHEPIESLDSEIDTNASFVYGEHYRLGDIVSVKNTKLGLTLHPRITEVVETFSKEGQTIEIKFGSNIPSLIQQIKKAVK